MKPSILTFHNQKLVVDYITFKFQELQTQPTKISHYLFHLGFNVYKKSGKLAKPIEESILFKKKNKYKITFVVDNPYWNGTLLQFSGLNASRFYFLVKQNIIDWEVFDTAVLSRFDLYFDRESKETDQISITNFFSDCQKELKQKNKKVVVDYNQKGWILKIGSRRSNNYSRFYEKTNSLRFEHEMKGRFIKPYHSLLVGNHLSKFEHKLSSYFFEYFGKFVPLHYSYFDWLVVKVRPSRKSSIYSDSFNSDYIKSEIQNDSRKLITFLQFLNYAHLLDSEIKNIENIPYRVVTFRLQDFLIFQNNTKNNRYQLKKLKNFFQELQSGILLTSFSDSYFQSLAAVPFIRFEKIQKFLVVKVWLVEELFYYSYPFCLPNLFNTKLNTDEFEVRFHFLKTFTSVNIEKVFLIQEFLTSYPSIISNQRKNNIKKYHIQLVQQLQDSNLITSNYKILYDGSFISTDKLTPSNISEGFIIYEKISV